MKQVQQGLIHLATEGGTCLLIKIIKHPAVIIDIVGTTSSDTVIHPFAETLSRRQPIRRKLYYQLDSLGMPAEKVGYCEQPRNDEGRWTKTTEPLPKLKDLFVMAMEGRTQRPYNEVMAVALKKCGVKDAQAYYALFREAEEQGIIRKMEHPETQANWVEFIENELPF